MDTLRRRSRNHMTVLAVTWKVKKTRTHEFLFTISIFWLQCDYSMKLQRFYFFKYFAQNTDIHFSGQSAKLHDWPIMGSQLLVQRTTSYFLSYQDCHLFQEQFVLNIEINGSVQLFQKIGTVYQIQSRLELTSLHAGNRCWQILTSRPRETVNQHTKKFFRRDVQGGCNGRRSWLVTALHSLSRGPGEMCSHIPLKERSQIRKVMLQKWRYKNRSTVFILTSANTDRELFHERKRQVNWKQQNAKANLGTITNSLPWYKISPFSGCYPCETKNFTGDGEDFYGSFQSRRRSQKLFIWTIY